MNERIFDDNGDFEKETPYKPAIRFSGRGLIVSFDHNLSLRPDDMESLFNRNPVPVTHFFVKEGAELYFGLNFIALPILEEVADGLRRYLVDDKWTEKERKLIREGVHQLEAMIATRSE